MSRDPRISTRLTAALALVVSMPLSAMPVAAKDGRVTGLRTGVRASGLRAGQRTSGFRAGPRQTGVRAGNVATGLPTGKREHKPFN